MPLRSLPSPAEIRQLIAESPGRRPADIAAAAGIGEAALVAAQGGVRIAADPDLLMPALTPLGEVMALTRTPSVVHEKVGSYDNYRSGDHAAMILNGAIDLRIFPRHWVHAFAVRTETETGLRRSIQVFDAAGDAVHKVHCREGSDIAVFDALVTNLATGETAETFDLEERAPVESPKSSPGNADVLRAEWARMTDTHQFMRLTSKLRMNRLGAYRIAGAPFVRALAPTALNDALTALAGSGTEVMIFVGNRGCIQIHSGPIVTLSPMGPWQNVMDPGFNLHLRADHVAEVWAVDKPTKRGAALSIEVFDAEGALILQIFGHRKESGGIDHTGAFRAVIDALPDAATVSARDTASADAVTEGA